jgi:hypothetical protein
MRVQVGDIWYKCDSEGGDVEIYGYGGKVTCPGADKVCNPKMRTDLTWPDIYGIEPTKGKPSQIITITGKNFKRTDKIEVFVEGPCTEVNVTSDSEITAKIPGPDFFVGISDLAIFERKQLVVVKDSRGYTSDTLFSVQVDLNGTYLENLFGWMVKNPMWSLIIIAIIVIPCACCIYCCCKGFKKPKKPKRKNHTDDPTEHYYNDHYGVDDYYDDYEDVVDDNNYSKYYDYKH